MAHHANVVLRSFLQKRVVAIVRPHFHQPARIFLPLGGSLLDVLQIGPDENPRAARFQGRVFALKLQVKIVEIQRFL